MIALLLVPLTHAWSTDRRVWAGEDLPVTVAWAGLPDGLEHDDVVEALEASRAAWAAASCGAFDVTFVEQDTATERDYDGVNALVFGDGDGTHERTSVYEGDATIVVEGTDYSDIEEADITLTALTFAPDAAIDGSCSDTWSFQALMTRAVGELAGLGPSCEPGECTVPGLEEATMYESLQACDTSASSLEDDDRLGIRWLYGNGFGVVCTPDASDPMAAVCTTEVSAGGTTRWDHGDDSSAEGATVTHSYAEPGAYVVTACTDIEGCDTPSCDRKVVWAVAPGTVTGADPVDEEPEAGGCASAPSPAAGLLAPLLLVVARRSRARTSR